MLYKLDFMSIPRIFIEDVDYWRGINPSSQISSNPWSTDCDEISFSKSEIQSFKLSLLQDGYFQTRPCILESQLERLIACIKIVVSEGHAPGYALLYDDFFHVLASLGSLLRSLLGPDFLIVPDEPDVYAIPTSNLRAGRGTEPHRDTLRAPEMRDINKLPGVINLWIPITDATTLNSCMHVIPAFADQDFGTPESNYALPEKIDTRLLQSVRALPAKAGSILGWSTELIHWGGQSSARASQPRLSFAMYFQGSSQAKIHPTAVSVPFSLDFGYRLYLIEKVWRDRYGAELHKFL